MRNLRIREDTAKVFELFYLQCMSVMLLLLVVSVQS